MALVDHGIIASNIGQTPGTIGGHTNSVSITIPVDIPPCTALVSQKLLIYGFAAPASYPDHSGGPYTVTIYDPTVFAGEYTNKSGNTWSGSAGLETALPSEASGGMGLVLCDGRLYWGMVSGTELVFKLPYESSSPYTSVDLYAVWGSGVDELGPPGVGILSAMKHTPYTYGPGGSGASIDSATFYCPITATGHAPGGTVVSSDTITDNTSLWDEVANGGSSSGIEGTESVYSLQHFDLTPGVTSNILDFEITGKGWNNDDGPSGGFFEKSLAFADGLYEGFFDPPPTPNSISLKRIMA